MTCSAKHPFCFKCLLLSVEATNELKNCPMCRGGDKYIKLENAEGQESSDFYTLSYFKKSIPILQKILNENISANSCLVSEYLLINYVKNKKQLDIVLKLFAQDYKLSDLIPLIKWNERKSMDDIGGEFLGNLISAAANDFFGGPPPEFFRPPRPDGPTNEQNGPSGPRFGGPPPPFFSGPFPFPFSSSRR